MKFIEKLDKATAKNNSLVCVGLDTSPELLPEGVSPLDFNREIIDSTADLVCAYKPNFAFYEAQGEVGMDILYKTVKHIPSNIPVIADAKRGDIGNTSAAYARAIFEQIGCDAVTVSPYLGFDSVEPFLKYSEKGIFLLCRTSNKGAADFQSLVCRYGEKMLPLYQVVAMKASEWNTNGNLGLVLGATYPEELKTIRQTHRDLPLLIPGVGTQGGDLELAVKYGMNDGNKGIIINSSRGIIYASRGKDFAEAARKATQTLRDDINRYR